MGILDIRSPIPERLTADTSWVRLGFLWTQDVYWFFWSTLPEDGHTENVVDRMVAAMGASHDDNIIRVGQLGHSAINMTRLLSGPACSAILLRHFGAPPLCADGTSCHRTLVPHRVRCGTLSYIGCELLVIRKLRSFVDYFLGRPSLYCTIPFHRRKPYFVARGIHRQISNWTMDSGRSPMLAIDLGRRAFGHFNGPAIRHQPSCMVRCDVVSLHALRWIRRHQLAD